MLRTALLLLISTSTILVSCKKKEFGNSNAKLIFKFKFDSTQVRLNNIGQTSIIPAGNAGQSPIMTKMSCHYLELAPGAFTLLGTGAVLYHATETTAGGSKAIDFSQAKMAGNNEVFLELPISQVAKGEYEWIRLSLAYQNGDAQMRIDTVINGIPIQQYFTASIASFIGYNTYISNFKVKNETITVNANRLQGFWGFETTVNVLGTNYPIVSNGQAPPGATTVVNPLFNSSPIPAGSCVVTAAFANGKLKITGNETTDIIVECSFSTNKSFEWKDLIPNNRWEPLKGEALVDMGVRGLIPTIK